jgi:excisionase family DNA binding protein
LPDDELWTTRELQEFLKVSQTTIEKWRRQRGLPYVRLGRVVRFVPNDVRAWVASWTTVIVTTFDPPMDLRPIGRVKGTDSPNLAAVRGPHRSRRRVVAPG